MTAAILFPLAVAYLFISIRVLRQYERGVVFNLGKFSGVRGPLTFSKEPGYKFQQWVDIPYVNYQLTEVNQPVSKSNLIQGPGQPLNVGKLQKAK